MNTLPAKELKRRGVAVIEELLADGPVEIIKNNRPACVVLSIEQYREMMEQHPGSAPRHRPKVSELFSLPPRGRRSREEIDAELHAERESWSER